MGEDLLSQKGSKPRQKKIVDSLKYQPLWPALGLLGRGWDLGRYPQIALRVAWASWPPRSALH